jgi:hypothetical protein
MTTSPGGAFTPFFHVAEDDQPQRLSLRCRLMRAVPGGSRVRLVPAVPSTFLGGFMPEVITGASASAEAPAWPIEDRLTAESLARLTYPPRPMLIAQCPGAAAGEAVLITGTFYSAVPGLWPIHHTSYAGISNEFLLEVEEGTSAAGAVSAAPWTPVCDRFGFRISPGAVDQLDACIDSDSCHRRRRRQQDTPLPQPKCVGKSRHRRSRRMTYMMPPRAARSGTRGRPPRARRDGS